MMSKSKTYYIHDLKNKMLYTELGIDQLKDHIKMQYMKDNGEYLIYEYGLEEKRGLGFKLDPKYCVDKRFIINLDKETIDEC